MMRSLKGEKLSVPIEGSHQVNIIPQSTLIGQIIEAIDPSRKDNDEERNKIINFEGHMVTLKDLFKNM